MNKRLKKAIKAIKDLKISLKEGKITSTEFLMDLNMAKIDVLNAIDSMAIKEINKLLKEEPDEMEKFYSDDTDSESTQLH